MRQVQPLANILLASLACQTALSTASVVDQSAPERSNFGGGQGKLKVAIPMDIGHRLCSCDGNLQIEVAQGGQFSWEIVDGQWGETHSWNRTLSGGGGGGGQGQGDGSVPWSGGRSGGGGGQGQGDGSVPWSGGRSGGGGGQGQRDGSVPWSGGRSGSGGGSGFGATGGGQFENPVYWDGARSRGGSGGVRGGESGGGQGMKHGDCGCRPGASSPSDI
ncbi:hypothetical protein CNMCM8694_008059 [Aspergillus lentulus]|nr:hypothetical protein CNMCM8694_008059 [Aspergillus lentulus]